MLCIGRTESGHYQPNWSDLTFPTGCLRPPVFVSPRPPPTMTDSTILTIVHQPTSDPGLVGQVLNQWGFALDRRCPAAGDSLPSDLDGYSGVVVFGGPMSANDDQTLPFIQAELAWIERVLAARIPYLGICLGAQLLARVLGARVTVHPQGLREAGYYPILPTDCGRGLFPQPMMVYQWHQEGFSLPHQGRLLATGETFPHQAFSYGERAFGLQFHPEMTPILINRWTTDGADQLTLPGTQSRPYHLSQHRLYHRRMEQWLQRFLRHWLTTGTTVETAWGNCHHDHRDLGPQWPYWSDQSQSRFGA